MTRFWPLVWSALAMVDEARRHDTLEALAHLLEGEASAERATWGAWHAARRNGHRVCSPGLLVRTIEQRSDRA